MNVALPGRQPAIGPRAVVAELRGAGDSRCPVPGRGLGDPSRAGRLELRRRSAMRSVALPASKLGLAILAAALSYAVLWRSTIRWRCVTWAERCRCGRGARGLVRRLRLQPRDGPAAADRRGRALPALHRLGPAGAGEIAGIVAFNSLTLWLGVVAMLAWAGSPHRERSASLLGAHDVGHMRPWPSAWARCSSSMFLPASSCASRWRGDLVVRLAARRRWLRHSWRLRFSTGRWPPLTLWLLLPPVGLGLLRLRWPVTRRPASPA